MVKSDLKDGMEVTYRNGSKRFVLTEILYAKIGEDVIRGGSFEQYTNDLLYSDTEYKELDILKVEYMGQLLWERIEDTPEQKEIERLQGLIEDAQAALSVLEEQQ